MIEPGSAEWLRYCTPSKVPAILGISRFESPYRLWHRLKGLVPAEAPKDIFDMGHDLEPYAANRWRRKNGGWLLSPGEVQFVVAPGKYEFPAAVTLDRRAVRGRARRVVEFKTARTLSDLEQWGDDLTGDIPEDYAAQVTAQMLFTGWTKHPGHLLAVGPYFNERIYEVPYDLGVAAWIIEQCTQFWASLAGETPPPLDDTVATYECLRAQHPDIEAGAEVPIAPALALRYSLAVTDEKAAKTSLQGAKNELLAAMTTAQYAKVGTLTVADRRNNGRGGVALYAGRSATPDNIRHMAAEELHP